MKYITILTQQMNLTQRHELKKALYKNDCVNDWFLDIEIKPASTFTDFICIRVKGFVLKKEFLKFITDSTKDVNLKFIKNSNIQILKIVTPNL